MKRWARRSDIPSEIADVQVVSDCDSLADMICAEASDPVEREPSDWQFVSEESSVAPPEQPRAKARATPRNPWDGIGISSDLRLHLCLS